MFKRNWITAMAIAAGLTLAGSTAAFAGSTPTPTPKHHNQLKQQEFDLVQAVPLHNGWVLGTGPISIIGGIDKTTANPRVDLFESANGLNGVRINHELLGGATIDRLTCSVNLTQVDLPWSIHQGFGTFAGAIGNGFYDLVGQFSYPTRNNICTLPIRLTTAHWLFIQNYLNGLGLPTPLSVDISVQAVGRAAVTPLPTPTPTPSRTYFLTPNGSPSS